jgi:hypothetical protein
MASGQQRIIQNDKERAISDDINRLQSFIAAARAEIFRAMFNDVLGNFYSRPGIAVRYAASPTDAPLPAEVYGGLEVIVDSPNHLEVQPGVLMAYTGPASADDSPYVLAVDPGLTTVGILPFTANGGGGPRIDVIECQPTDTLLETDSRDIYDPATGTFSPVLVDKVRTSRLTYRIRNGTPAGGPPGYDPAWLPLAIAIVQPGASDFTEVDFYDVRPLVGERSSFPTAEMPADEMNSDIPAPLDALELLSSIDGADTNVVRGWFKGSALGYLMGGDVRRNTPSNLTDFGSTALPDGGDVAAFDQGTAENLKPGLSLTVNGFYYIAAFFPSLSATNVNKPLPRWVRYSQNAQTGTPARRRPVGPRGILVLTDAHPSANGWISPSALPTIMGWTFNAWSRVVVPNVSTALVDDFMTGPSLKVWPDQIPDRVHTAVSASQVSWSLVYDTDLPRNASSLTVNVDAHMTGAAPNDTVTVVFLVTAVHDVSSGTGVNAARFEVRARADGSGNADIEFTVDVPLPPPQRAGAATALPAKINVTRTTTGGLDFSTAELRVLGYTVR